MGSLSGILGRPLTAAASVAVAAVAADFPDRLPHPKCPATSTITSPKLEEESNSWVSRVSIRDFTNISFASRVHTPLPDINYRIPDKSHPCTPNSLLKSYSFSICSPSILLTLYKSANLAKAPQTTNFVPYDPSPPSDVLYRWHLPKSNLHPSEKPECSSAKSRTVVVLLGWLGAKQKHLKRYADWYTSRGFHAITFTFPMTDIISYRVGGKAEQNIDLLVNHLASWVEEEHGKNLVFHTFSNTGWLTYGAILEKFQKQDPSMIARIKGCVVDSAPVAAADPQVWASGFSAAFLKKQSIATKGSQGSSELGMGGSIETLAVVEPQPAAAETALLVVLEKFFEVVLNLPSVSRRLADVLGLLSSEQPKCPQLYIYSSADRVIPAKAVESFIEEQRRAGHEVRACNFISSPHVDHFRNDPNLYSSQLTAFLEDYILFPCGVSSQKTS